MLLLLTRPLAEARRTANLLRQGGHEVVLSPVIEIVALEPVWPRLRPEALIATSAHAFIRPLPEACRDLPLFIVGASRGAGSGHRGPVHEARGNRHALLALLQETPFRHFLYLAGRQRKHDLEQELVRTAQIDVCEVYDAVAAAQLTPQAQDALRAGRIGGVLHYSRRSAEIFIDLAQKAGLGAALRPVTHYCLSEDVAQPLRAAGLDCATSAEPNEQALLALI